MLTPDVHPPREGEPAFALDREHHDHGPLGPDDFEVYTAADAAADAAEDQHYRDAHEFDDVDLLRDEAEGLL